MGHEHEPVWMKLKQECLLIKRCTMGKLICKLYVDYMKI